MACCVVRWHGFELEVSEEGVPRLRMCWAYNVEPLAAVAVERASAIILAVFIVILVVSVSSNLNLKNGVATTATN